MIAREETTTAAGATMAPARERAWRRDLLGAAAMALVVPLVALRAMLLSGLARVPGTVIDGRLNAFFLEHSWGWLTRQPVHRALWGLPAFFPAGGNALAFSDAMLGYAPLYWPWRALGLPPDTSYELWLLAVFAVSAAVAYLFLARGLGLSPAAAAAGAWLATAASSHLHQISHSQLVPQFYLLGGLWAAAAWAGATEARARRVALAILAACEVAQLYSGFYLGVFLALAVGLLLLTAVALPSLRHATLARLRADVVSALLAGAAALAALVPWIAHYGAANRMVGGRRWDEVATMVPRPLSWLFVTPHALAYHWIRDVAAFRRLPSDFEHAVSLGWLTSVAVIVGAIAVRRRPLVRLAGLAMLLLVLLTTAWDGQHTLWRLVVLAVPPLGAVRALSRVALLLPVGAAVVLGAWLDSSLARDRAATPPGRRWRAPLAAAVVALCLAEQLCATGTHERYAQRVWVEEIRRRVNPAARAFIVTPSTTLADPATTQVDAMWAASLAGVPTVNGFSGIEPAGWNRLGRIRVRSPAAGARLRAQLAGWLAAQGGPPPAAVQWILLPPEYRAGARRAAAAR